MSDSVYIFSSDKSDMSESNQRESTIYKINTNYHRPSVCLTTLNST